MSGAALERVHALATDEPILPASPQRVRIGMPQMDAGGLSDNWLWRTAGDRHWEAISQRLGARSDRIRDDWGQRLYPTFVAVRARYQAPLAAVAENDVLTWSDADVRPVGRACAHGRVTADVAGARYALEMLTTFAVREAPGQLRMATPALRLASHWRADGVPPALVATARAARRGEPVTDPFCGPALRWAGTPLDRLTYAPSPYADYNGAGLLYFASYVTIADTAVRTFMHRRAAACGEWALRASAVARDVFFYSNLPLGEALDVELCDARPDSAGATDRAASVLCHARLRRADGRLMADVITRYATTEVA